MKSNYFWVIKITIWVVISSGLTACTENQRRIRIEGAVLTGYYAVDHLVDTSADNDDTDTEDEELQRVTTLYSTGSGTEFSNSFAGVSYIFDSGWGIGFYEFHSTMEGSSDNNPWGSSTNIERGTNRGKYTISSPIPEILYTWSYGSDNRGFTNSIGIGHLSGPAFGRAAESTFDIEYQLFDDNTAQIVNLSGKTKNVESVTAHIGVGYMFEGIELFWNFRRLGSIASFSNSTVVLTPENEALSQSVLLQSETEFRVHHLMNINTIGLSFKF